MSIVRTTIVITAAVITSGCYRWVPVERTAVPPAAEVRARLTDSGVEEMVRFYGPDVRHVEGALVSANGEGVSIVRQVSMRREGFPPTTVIDTLLLRSGYVAGLEIKEVDGPRTAGFTLAMAAGAVGALFAAKVFGGTPDEPGEGEGPDPDATILLRIPLRIGFR